MWASERMRRAYQWRGLAALRRPALNLRRKKPPSGGATRDRLLRLGVFFFSSRRRHTRFDCDWSSDVCSSDLIDPYARALEGEFVDHPAVYRGDEDSAPYVPRSVIVHGAFPWGGDRKPDIQIGRASCRERV